MKEIRKRIKAKQQKKVDKVRNQLVPRLKSLKSFNRMHIEQVLPEYEEHRLRTMLSTTTGQMTCMKLFATMERLEGPKERVENLNTKWSVGRTMRAWMMETCTM
jgi:hypothetical protein